jgi:hypothetical protein
VLTARSGWADTHDEIRPHAPWWWWLALAAYVGLSALELWVIYRTAAGHPVLGGIQW